MVNCFVYRKKWKQVLKQEKEDHISLISTQKPFLMEIHTKVTDVSTFLCHDFH